MAEKGSRRVGGKLRSPRGTGKERGDGSNSSPSSADMNSILGHFARALSMAVVCQRSLAAQELVHAGDEEETLREAIQQLRNVYNELDEIAR